MFFNKEKSKIASKSQRKKETETEDSFDVIKWGNGKIDSNWNIYEVGICFSSAGDINFKFVDS